MELLNGCIIPYRQRRSYLYTILCFYHTFIILFLPGDFHAIASLHLQKSAIRLISQAPYRVHTEPLFKNLNILKISDLLYLKALKFYYRYIKIELPMYFTNMFSTPIHILPDIEMLLIMQHLIIPLQRNVFITFLPCLTILHQILQIKFLLILMVDSLAM